ncbi:MAG: hypothetical protein LBS12_03715 [Prevotellaceae bacterium]|jgi:hypothetical protein|nr:hypothetical protein [Prevotellaceae bacterium]
MKKIQKLLLCVFCTILFACSNNSKGNDLIVENTLADQLMLLENNIENGNVEGREISMSSTYERFFNEVTKTRMYPQTEGSASFESNDVFIETIEQYPFKEDDVLSEEETIVLQSYFNSYQKRIMNRIVLTQYYLDEINKLDISQKSKLRCIAFLTFSKDWLLYIETGDSGKPQKVSSNIQFSSEDIPCDERECFDGCMCRETEAIFGNWLKAVVFISAPIRSAVLLASYCIVECV